MPLRIYTLLSAIIFLIVFALHLLRLIFGWPLRIDWFEVPMWPSWIAMIVAAYLSAVGFRHSSKK